MGSIVSLQAIEARIGIYMQGAYSNMLGVGRCLSEAKDSGLVPHGEWEDWVLRNTGFSVRQAQRLMQAAREIPEGSAMERLPISKVQTILALPAEDREAVAEIAVEESATVKELRGIVEQLKRERMEADRDFDATREKLIAEEARTQRLLNSSREQCREVQKQFKDMQDRYFDAKRALQDAEEQDAISKAAQDQIDELRTRLNRSNAERERMEEYAQRQAELRQKAQQELMNQRAAGATSSEMNVTSAADIVGFIRKFVGEAGVIAHMGVSLSGLNGAKRAELVNHIDMVADWVEAARRALSVVQVE